MKLKKVLIIDDLHDSIFTLLEELNLEVDYQPDISVKDILDSIHEYQGLILRSKIKIDHQLLDRAENLEFIARAGAGLDQIDVDMVQQRGIHLINTPEGNRDAVGEHTLGMLLALFNNIHIAHQEITQGIWNRYGNRGEQLTGKTIGIIGFGNTGKAFADKCKGFNCTILAYDKYKFGFASREIKESTLEKIYQEADVISLHVPLNDETRQIINYDFIDRFKKPVWIINTARGELLNLENLLQHIEAGKVKGACLDVLENENMKNFMHKSPELFKRLTQNKRVLLTPHIAGWSMQSYVQINQVLAEKIKDWLQKRNIR